MAAIDSIRHLEQRTSNTAASGLFLSAVTALEGLDYLGELDGRKPARYSTDNHFADMIDVAHVRWATSSCITVIDLCVAGLGQMYLPPKPRDREYSFSDIKVPLHGNQPSREWQLIPRCAQRWLRRVAADVSYSRVASVRHSLIHRQLARHLTIGPRGRYRLRFRFGDKRLAVGTVLSRARSAARRHFFSLVAVMPKLP